MGAVFCKKWMDTIVREIHETIDVSDCLRRISLGIESLTSPDYVSWVLLDGESRKFFNSYVHSRRETYRKPYHELVRNDGWSYRLINGSAPQYFADAREERSLHPDFVRMGILSVAMFPVWAGQSPVGAVFVNHKAARHFRKSKLNAVETLLDETASRLTQIPYPNGRLGRNEEVLILDDDDRMRARIAGPLSADGWAVISLSSIEEADYALMRHTPMVAFIDEDLPDGSGMKFGSLILQTCIQRGIRPPVLILMSDRSSRKIEAESKWRGFLAACDKRTLADAHLRALTENIRTWHRSVWRYRA